MALFIYLENHIGFSCKWKLFVTYTEHVTRANCIQYAWLFCDNSVLLLFFVWYRTELTREKEGLSTWLDGQKTGDVIFIESEPGEPTTVDLEVCSKDYDIQLNKAFILETSEILQVKIKDSAKIPKGGSCFVTLVAYSVDVASKTVNSSDLITRLFIIV